MTLRGSLCLLLVAGCNPIFDLESTDVDIDSDGDGIFDAIDVCPAIVDDQRDDDRDGIGNECDVCPSDANPDQHDEDGDQRGDACDLCPTQQDFADSDADADGIGDACDPFSGGAVARRPSRRLLFDPFVTLAPEWQPRQSSTWTIDDDRVGPDAKLGPDDGLAYPTLSLSANGHVDIVVFTKDHWEAGETFDRARRRRWDREGVVPRHLRDAQHVQDAIGCGHRIRDPGHRARARARSDAVGDRPRAPAHRLHRRQQPLAGAGHVRTAGRHEGRADRVTECANCVGRRRRARRVTGHSSCRGQSTREQPSGIV
jgi:hypothetical protein